MEHTPSILERLERATAAIRAIDPRTPDVAIVLGSGLGAFADTLTHTTQLPYRDIPGMSSVTVPGHAGRLVMGRLPSEQGPVVAALAGRIHLYEGHSPSDVVFNVRLMIRLGAKTIVLTNAAGGVSPDYTPGDLVLLSDHINLQGRSALMGPNESALGPRFPDMSTVYSPELRDRARAAAADLGITLREGVYAGLLGPSYETPAEIRMLKVLGADLVGMSTVAEATAARHMGARVLGISCVTNLAAGVSKVPLSHAEVEETANATRPRFVALLHKLLGSLP